MDMADIKRRIAALLAKANDTAATEPEAQAFNAKAHELMMKYNIERAELEAGGAKTERLHLKLRVQLRPWSQYVLQGLTRLYHCKYFSIKLDAKGRSHEITLIGEKQNVAVCHTIAIMVLRSIQIEARREGDGRSFLTGAGYRVYERCVEMASYSERPSQLEAQKLLPAQRQALVVMAIKEEDGNADYVESVLGIKLRTRAARGPSVRDSGAFDRGKAHGNKVGLRQNLLN